jgi:hypothetical protein
MKKSPQQATGGTRDLQSGIDSSTDISSSPAAAKHPALDLLASRLCAVRAQISDLLAMPVGVGARNGPQRRLRDEDVLGTFAADLRARMVEARTS